MQALHRSGEDWKSFKSSTKIRTGEKERRKRWVMSNDHPLSSIYIGSQGCVDVPSSSSFCCCLDSVEFPLFSVFCVGAGHDWDWIHWDSGSSIAIHLYPRGRRDGILKEQSNFVAQGAGGLENKDRLESSWTPTFHKDNQREDESSDVSPSDSSLKWATTSHHVLPCWR
jgi:hypothetical protein